MGKGGGFTLWGVGVSIFMSGVVCSVFERIYAPDYLVSQNTPYPEWFPLLGLFLISLGPTLMILDEILKRKKGIEKGGN